MKEAYERLTDQLNHMAHDNLSSFQQEFEEMKEEIPMGFPQNIN
jgi:hypothetical protein